MRRVLVALAMLGCGHPPPPAPPPPPPPQCIPKLQQGIVQLRDLSEAVPAGVSANQAFDAMTDFLTSIGVSVAASDRTAHTIVSKPFPGETIEWSCDMFEYRQYAYRISVVDHRWVVGMDCQRQYGWEAHMSGDQVVPAERGILTECLESAKYTSQLDAMRARNLVDGAREVLRQRRSE